MSTSYAYVGLELDLFAAAAHWKAYVRRRVAPFLGPRVLEIGAGRGGTTRALCDGRAERWVCLEPDAALAERLAESIQNGELPDCCAPRIGTLADLEERGSFDSVLYMDVLEHIANDRAELQRAAEQLRPGGRLVVLAPAHQWLFTPFDAAIGHHRRYTKRTLEAAVPSGLVRARLEYLDAVGLFASLGNRLVLKRAMPTPAQIGVWDRAMVPLSRLVDPLLGRALGKSVLGVWRKP